MRDNWFLFLLRAGRHAVRAAEPLLRGPVADGVAPAVKSAGTPELCGC